MATSYYQIFNGNGHGDQTEKQPRRQKRPVDYLGFAHRLTELRRDPKSTLREMTRDWSSQLGGPVWTLEGRGRDLADPTKMARRGVRALRPTTPAGPGFYSADHRGDPGLASLGLYRTDRDHQPQASALSFRRVE